MEVESTAQVHKFSSVAPESSHEPNASDGTQMGLRTGLKWAPERDCAGAGTVSELLILAVESLTSTGSGLAQCRSRGSASTRVEASSSQCRQR